MSILDPDNLNKNEEREEEVKDWQSRRTAAGGTPSITINEDDLVTVIDRQTGARSLVTIDALLGLINE